MKKVLLFVSLFTFGASYAQDCSKIFISEYVEGWSNNKAIEIYNPTSASVNLSEYFVARYSNGSTSATVANSVQLTGTIGAHSVYVAVLDKRDPNGTGQEAPVWDSLQAKADGFYAPVYTTSNSFYFNGNDAILLAKGTLPASASASVTTAAGFEIVDIFGKIGQDPLNADGTTDPDGAWTTTFPYSNGIGVLVTQDYSLIRKSTVLKGEITNVSFFNPLEQWDSIPATTYLFDNNGDTLVSGNGNPILFGNWFSLGSHSCNCGDASVIEEAKEVKSLFAVYPNPSTNGLFHVEASAGVESVTVYNSLGQVVKTQKFNNENASIRISDLPGVYIMKVQTGNGVVSKRVIVK